VIRALEKTYVLGNASVIDKTYVCTVPIELNSNLSVLLDLASKYGFISARLLAKEKKWSNDEFEHNIRELRTKGVVWIDKQVPQGPHFYFLSHLGTDLSPFFSLMKQF
jgi:biotin operon repressor